MPCGLHSAPICIADSSAASTTAAAVRGFGWTSPALSGTAAIMPRAYDTKSYQNGLATSFPLNQALVDNTRIGSFWTLLSRTINLADTTFTIGLGRKPSGYIVIRNVPGGIVYDGTNGGTDWSSSVIVVRASSAGTYSLLVF